jgi:hypothetical protein
LFHAHNPFSTTLLTIAEKAEWGKIRRKNIRTDVSGEPVT